MEAIYWYLYFWLLDWVLFVIILLGRSQRIKLEKTVLDLGVAVYELERKMEKYKKQTKLV